MSPEPRGTDPFTVEELDELTAEPLPVTEVIPPKRCLPVTPEDKEAAMDAVAEAVAQSIKTGDTMRALAERVYSRLLEPRITKCETCGGRGFYLLPVTGDNDPKRPCPADCDQGQIVRPSIAVLRGDLEQVSACRGAMDHSQSWASTTSMTRPTPSPCTASRLEELPNEVSHETR